MRKVAIVGVGLIKWGELWEKSLRQIAAEAIFECLEDAGTDRIDAMTIGNMSGGLFNGQEHLSSLIPDFMGLKNIPAMRIESACASGGMAVRTAYLEVASGLSDFAVAVGVEKMTDISGQEATYALATAADQDHEAFHGVTFPGLYAMMAKAHMDRYGTTREDLSSVVIKNHKNGSLNPNAQFPFEITGDQVLRSPMVADPLRLLDCSPISDGAAAVMLTTLEEAEKLKKQPVLISGIGHATDSLALSSRNDILKMEAVEQSASKALEMAGKSIEDIDFAEVHDCFSIAEIMILEALGVVPPGEGGKASSEGLTALNGKFPVNPSGGLKSKGHPVGATGVAQICEAVAQLKGEAGKRQLKNVKAGLTQNMGGSAGSSVVHILEVI
ncbi:MAG: thiolase domain-containing protein [Acidobacteriota bacterium]